MFSKHFSLPGPPIVACEQPPIGIHLNPAAHGGGDQGLDHHPLLGPALLCVGAGLLALMFHDLGHEAGPHIVLLLSGIQRLRGSRSHHDSGLAVGAHLVVKLYKQ